MAPVKKFKESWLQQTMLNAAGELAKASSYDLAKEADLIEDFFEQSPKADIIPEPVELAIQNEVDAIEAEGLDYVLPDIVSNAKGLKTAAQIFGDAVSIYIGSDKVEEPVPPAPKCQNCTFSWADANPTSFDLAHVDDTYAMRIGLQQFEGLLTFATGNNPPEPGVASHYSVSQDGLRYTFYLREDAKWSNGRPIVADDFVYAWRRVLDPKTGALSASDMLMLKNAAAILNGEIKDLDKLGLRAINDHILEVTLEFPLAQFPMTVCNTIFTPAPREIIEKYGKNWTDPKNIVVNGPYRLSEYRDRDRTILVKNGNYWNNHAVQIETITIRHTNEGDTQVRLYQSGQIDWVTNMPMQQIQTWRQSADFFTEPIMGIYEYVFNPGIKPLDNPLVRGALNMAVDREILAKQVLQGCGAIADSFMPQMFQELHQYQPPKASFSYDPDKARRLLAEAGFPDGAKFPVLMISVSQMDFYKETSEFVQRQLEKNLAIKVNIHPFDFSTLIGNLRKGRFELSREAYSAPYPDGLNFFNRFVTGNPDNYARYSNPEYDKLVIGAKMQSDQERRNQLLQEAEVILNRDLPIIPLFYLKRAYLLRRGIEGFEENMTQKHLVKYIRRK